MAANRHTQEAWDDDEDAYDDEFSADDADEESDTQPCPHCHRQIYEDAERCPYCDNYVLEEDADSGRKPWWVVATVFLCLAMVVWWIVSGL